MGGFRQYTCMSSGQARVAFVQVASYNVRVDMCELRVNICELQFTMMCELPVTMCKV